jgi:threonylcarbamoyladenosine tRNA methylthiotransferase MtaB
MQSGSDRILKLMRRQYTSAQFITAVESLRTIFPEANIGTDVIPGFPSESDEDFAQTIDTIHRAKLNYLHVFPYSKRPNTAAEKMPNHLDITVIKRRAETLRELSRELKAQYEKLFIGKSNQVLWENRLDRDGRYLGTTRNYLTVVASKKIDNISDLEEQIVIKGYTAEGHLLSMALS